MINRIVPTHFIEVWKSSIYYGVTYHTLCGEIKMLNHALYVSEIITIETIAIWKIKFKYK
jgi:hypothetical protein